MLEIRCVNPKAHYLSKTNEGKLLCMVDEDGLFMMCSDRRCKTWYKLKFNFYGLKLDFSKAAIEMTRLPKGQRFDTKKATVLIEEAE